MDYIYPSKKNCPFSGIFIIAGLVFASFGSARVNGLPTGGAGSKRVPLFTALGTIRMGGDPIAPQAQRYRAVTVNPLISKAGGVAVGDQLFISPFDDTAVLGTIDRIETDVNGVVGVRARIQEQDGYLLLSSDKDRSLGRLILPQRPELEISCLKDGVNHIVQEFEPSARLALDDSPSLLSPSASNRRSPMPPAGSAFSGAANTVIDCMIVYTPAARDHANLSSGINNFISLAMQQGQLGMDNSPTNITLRLAYSALVDYTESGSSSTDLTRLTQTADGFMDQVHTWRSTYGADLVHLFTKVDDTGGIGWLLTNPAGSPSYAFSIGRVQQVTFAYTTVHEMGHNMGCHHRKDQVTQPGPGLFSYSAGWRWVGTDTYKYCSIMSYTELGDTRVAYFSNPSIFHKGAPTGNAVDGDNARTLREIKAVISNYRTVNRAVKNDFNGDGQEDILWRYSGSGTYQGWNVVWYMPPVALASLGPREIDPLRTAGTNQPVKLLPYKFYWSPLYIGNRVPSPPQKSFRTPLEAGKAPAARPTMIIRHAFPPNSPPFLPAKDDGLLAFRNAAEICLRNSGPAPTAASAPSGQGYLPTIIDTNWEIAGTGDFNGDGDSDILWRYYGTGGYAGWNVIWYMHGTVEADYAYLPTISDTNWHIEGTGDVDADGALEILWRYYGSGGYQGWNVLWHMNGTNIGSYTYLPTVTDTNWRVDGIGDFNTDGKAELFWRCYAGGLAGWNVIWYLNGATISNYGYPPTVSDTHWKVDGTGDFNRDGRADLIWRYYGTGPYQGWNVIWCMNGAGILGYDYPTAIADPNWRIVNR